MGTWTNSDGLHVKLGVTEGDAGRGGMYSTLGPVQVMEVTTKTLNSTNYPFGSTIYVIDDNVFMPKARYEWVEIHVVTAATSAGSPTIDIGLQRTDRTTEIDYDGFVAAATLAQLDGEAGITRRYLSEATDSVPTPVLGGALLGTTTTNVGYLTLRVNTADFTAGVLKIRVGYWFP